MEEGEGLGTRLRLAACPKRFCVAVYAARYIIIIIIID